MVRPGQDQRFVGPVRHTVFIITRPLFPQRAFVHDRRAFVHDIRILILVEVVKFPPDAVLVRTGLNNIVHIRCNSLFLNSLQ
jgi:hypothetical protein